MKTTTTKTAIFTLLIAGAALLSGCLGEYNPPEIKRTDVTVIVNEGTVADKNGSVRLYIENQNVLNPAVRNLSGNIQSTVRVQESLWVVANNPDKVSIIDLIYDRMTELPATELQTPRYADYYIDNYESKLFISNWGDSVTVDNEHPESFVAVYNLNNYYLPPTKLPCGSDAEGLFVDMDAKRLFVATKAGVVAFDLSKTAMPRDTVLTSAQFSGHAKQFVFDSTGVVWVSYSDGGVMGFNPKTYAVTAEYPIPLDSATGAIATDMTWTKIISYSVEPTVIYATDLATGTREELIRGSFTPTSIGVCPVSGNIYTSDTKADGKSALLIFDKDGNKIVEEAEVGYRMKGYTFFMVLS